MEQTPLSDFPKIQCPFIRQTFKRGQAKETVMAEGVVFYNMKRKEHKKRWMAKLRRDMFDWFYTDQIEIPDYDPAGRDEVEDQDKFD